MATYQRRTATKKKKYKLQNPRRFAGFIGIVIALIVLLIFAIQSCGKAKTEKNETSVASGDKEESSLSLQNTAGSLGDLQKQTIAWTAGLVNMTKGISTVEEEEPPVIPTIYTVVIDPGCGGTDSGNPGSGNMMEKTINLEVALKLKSMLETNYPEIEVIMTRNGDSTVSTAQRIEIINEAGADLALSLHCDYFAGSSERKGVTSYYRQGYQQEESHEESGTGAMSLDAKAYHVAQVLQKKAVEALETEDRGTQQERYEILNSTEIPVVLMEMAYLTDTSDYAKITDSAYQTALAEALAEGIHEELLILYPNRAQEAAGIGNSSQESSSSTAQ